MIEIRLKFNGRDLAEKEVAIVTAGSVETATASFSFDAAWDGFARTAIFVAGGTTKRLVLGDDGVCVVPWEVLAECKPLTVGVVGIDGSRVLPSVPVTVQLTPGIYNAGTAPEDPTPDVYAQLLSLAKETEQIAQSVRDDADAGKFKGAKGDKGDPGDKGDTGSKGDKGDKGDQGAKGDKGDKGDPGKDGVSPTVATEAITGGTKVTVTDAAGAHAFDVMDGVKGDKGDKGEQGAKGDQGDAGTSVTVSSVSESTADSGSNVVTFSDGKQLTVKNGSKGSKGDQGDKGDQGIQGIQGVQGVRGTAWFAQAYEPEGSDVITGDLWLDGNGDVRKAAASADTVINWKIAANIKGAKGDKGDKGDTGAKGDKGDLPFVEMTESAYAAAVKDADTVYLVYPEAST